MNICVYDNDCLNNVRLMEVFKNLDYRNILWFFEFSCCEKMLKCKTEIDLFIVSWECERKNTKKSACSIIRESGYSGPIIFTTENRNIAEKSEDLEEYLELKESIYKHGIINVILKPYDIDKVFSKIQSAKRIIENRKKILQVEKTAVSQHS